MTTPPQGSGPVAIMKPDWSHQHGVKMSVRQFSHDELKLVIANNAACLTIASRTQQEGGGWQLTYEVVWSHDSQVNGRVGLHSHELRTAFGLDNDPGKHGEWLVARFGADTAAQGKYIRRGDYLNIPGPGTGNDGDPNISIELDDEIRDAIRRLTD